MSIPTREEARGELADQARDYRHRGHLDFDEFDESCELCRDAACATCGSELPSYIIRVTMIGGTELEETKLCGHCFRQLGHKVGGKEEGT
jgi:hypothetical protein